tara:strand:+ start:759 stop:1502 length:744 start_codon:yes stop_codon:yes gene_type:complete
MTVNGTKISFQPLSAASIRIKGDTEDIIPSYYENELLSLELPDGKKISVGETIKIKRAPYKINIIESNIIDDELFYDLKTASPTKSSLFVLPMLGGNRKLLFYDSLLVNTFIETTEDEDCIALLYRKSAKKVFKEFCELLTRTKSFKRMYEPTKYHIVIVFNIPYKHKFNYKAFKKGKYSKFRDTYKLQILDFHRFDIDGVMGQILFKSHERKKLLEKRLDAILPEDSELYSIMNKKDETFNENYYF